MNLPDDITELLEYLQSQGVTITLEDGNPHLQGNPSLIRQIRPELRLRKTEILHALGVPQDVKTRILSLATGVALELSHRVLTPANMRRHEPPVAIQKWCPYHGWVTFCSYIKEKK